MRDIDESLKNVSLSIQNRMNRELRLYIGMAIGLAYDKSVLKELHSRLRDMVQKSPLMEGSNYCRSVERMYRALLFMDDM